MKQRILHLFTRTPLHVGAGSSVGYLDQPVQRERHTGHPLIPGSSIKGVLRDRFEANPETKDFVDELFGKEDATSPGKIAFGEAHLLLFPVRSAKGSFAFATSPLCLRRYNRDADLKLPIPEMPKDMHCLAGGRLVIERAQERGVVLEEYRFQVDGSFPSDWEDVLSGLLTDEVLRAARGRLVLLSDGDLSHFAMNACQVSQHVCIDADGTAKDGGLFNEETVPSETLFYAALTPLKLKVESNAVFDHLAGQEQLIQFGGNGTTGLGFCTAKLA